MVLCVLSSLPPPPLPRPLLSPFPHTLSLHHQNTEKIKTEMIYDLSVVIFNVGNGSRAWRPTDTERETDRDSVSCRPRNKLMSPPRLGHQGSCISVVPANRLWCLLCLVYLLALQVQFTFTFTLSITDDSSFWKGNELLPSAALCVPILLARSWLCGCDKGVTISDQGKLLLLARTWLCEGGIIKGWLFLIKENSYCQRGLGSVCVIKGWLFLIKENSTVSEVLALWVS